MRCQSVDRNTRYQKYDVVLLLFLSWFGLIFYACLSVWLWGRGGGFFVYFPVLVFVLFCFVLPVVAQMANILVLYNYIKCVAIRT